MGICLESVSALDIFIFIFVQKVSLWMQFVGCADGAFNSIASIISYSRGKLAEQARNISHLVWDLCSKVVGRVLCSKVRALQGAK